MPSCVVKSCKNYFTKYKRSHGITYHVFPRDIPRRDQWVQIIRACRKDNKWNASSASTVCSAHFDEADFKRLPNGQRGLGPYAIPKRLLSSPTGIKTSTSHIPQVSSNIRVDAKYQQPSSPPIAMSVLQLPIATVKLEPTGYCRLCAASDSSGKLLHLQSDDVLKKLVVKMLDRLNTNVDFDLEHLPTSICVVCVEKLYTAYDFVGGIDQAQVTLNNTTNAWTMENENVENNLDLSSTVTLQTVSTNTGAAEHDFEQPPHAPSESVALPEVSSNTASATRDFKQPPSILPTYVLVDTPGVRGLNGMLNKKKKLIEGQNKKIKTLNQKIRRLENRNQSLKSKLNNIQK